MDKKYRVYPKPAVRFFEVEARNEEEAEEKAFEMYDAFGYQEDFIRFVVEEVKEFTTIGNEEKDLNE